MMELNKVLLPTAYLPNLQYMACIVNADEAWIEGCENYVKQSYRNRSYILTANGVIRLTVPVIHHGKVPIRELEIDYRQNWPVQHWRAIQSAYAKAPFFEHFGEYIKEAILTPISLLFQYNQNLLQLFLQLLRVKKQIDVTTTFQREPSPEFWDGRKLIHPKNELQTHTPAYYQCFGSDFEQNLSIIDLLFCEGPQSLHHLRQIKFNLQA